MNTDSKKLTKEEKQELKRIETLKSNIEEATKNVNSLMSKYLNCFQVINDKASLISYMDACLARGGVAIDTETTGLDVYSDKLVGICIYTSGQQEAYIPINHVDYITRDRLPDQLDPDFVVEQMNRLKDIKVVMHNANFDIRVLRQFGIYLDCHWDTMIAANVLDENEEHGLKELYNKYILKDQKDDFNFGKLFSFKGTTFADIPINVAAVYAAHDAKMTYELYRFQVNQFKTHKYLLGAWSLFRDIEMPCVKAICDMEDTGFMFNKEYHNYLEQKYHTLLDEEEEKLYNELSKYKDQIAEWRLTPDANKKEQKLDKDGNLKFDKKGNPEYSKSKNEQLPEGDLKEIKLSSPTQLAIILYDVMKLKHNSKKDGPRSTSEQALISINNDFTNMILAYRSFSKMVSAFIDSLPEQVKDDGKIHCTLKQYGAKTGRMSCIAEGQKVETTKGPKNIEEVLNGEFVYCFTPDRKVKVSPVNNKIYNGIKDCFKYEFKNNKTGELIYLTCTPDHRVLSKTKNNFIEIDNLISNEEVYIISKQYNVERTKIYVHEGVGIFTGNKQYIRKLKVWDLEVNTYHNFIASGICVHNCSDPNLQQIPSRNGEIRQLFMAPIYKREVESKDNILIFKDTEEIELSPDNWVFVKDLKIGNIIETETEKAEIIKIENNKHQYKFTIKEI